MIFGQGVKSTTGSRLSLPTANILAAYDARAGVTNVSGACSAWADQSGNGWHAAQGTSGSRPTITTTGGFPSLQFDGSADFMSVASITAPAGTKSVYAVINPTTVGGAYRFITDIQTGRLAFGIMTTGDWGVFDGTNRASAITAATGLQRLSAEVLTGSSRVWRNGTVGASTSWTANSAVGGMVAIGAANNGAAFFYTGHLLFLAFYSAARNVAVESYITQEWGV